MTDTGQKTLSSKVKTKPQGSRLTVWKALKGKNVPSKADTEGKVVSAGRSSGKIHQKSDSGHYKSDWKTTKLFANNPEVPSVPHRAVQPIQEPVFSSKTFKDLSLHPFMVCNFLFIYLSSETRRDGDRGRYSFAFPLTVHDKMKAPHWQSLQACRTAPAYHAEVGASGPLGAMCLALCGEVRCGRLGAIVSEVLKNILCLVSVYKLSFRASMVRGSKRIVS